MGTRVKFSNWSPTFARPNPLILVFVQAGTAMYFSRRLRRGMRFPKDKKGRTRLGLCNEVCDQRRAWTDRLADVRSALWYFNQGQKTR